MQATAVLRDVTRGKTLRRLLYLLLALGGIWLVFYSGLILGDEQVCQDLIKIVLCGVHNFKTSTA